MRLGRTLRTMRWAMDHIDLFVDITIIIMSVLVIVSLFKIGPLNGTVWVTK